MSAPRYSIHRVKEDETIGGCVGLTLSVPVVACYYAVLHGYTLSTLWRWFVVPTFGVPEISKSMAAGLWLIVAALRYQVGRRDDMTTKQLLADTLWQAKATAFVLGALLLEGHLLHRWFV